MGSAFEVITMCPAIIRLRGGNPERRSRDGCVSACVCARGIFQFIGRNYAHPIGAIILHPSGKS